MIARTSTICVALALFTGCATPPPYKGGPLEIHDESTKYSLVDQHDGYEIHVFHEKDNDFGVSDVVLGLISAYLMVPGGGDLREFNQECEERIYSVAQQYAAKRDELQPYMQWERDKRLNDAISNFTPDGAKWSMGRGIRYRSSGGKTFECHLYAYFRWKAYAPQ